LFAQGARQMAAESREMLLTKMKEAIDDYFDVLLKDKNVSREDRLAELREVREWLEDKSAAVEGEREQVERR